MSTKTLVAVALSPEEPFEFREVELLPPRADEIRVRIEATGICHTDIAVKEQAFALPLPMVLGHEGAGVVEEIGAAVSQFEVGDHVVLAGDSCGHCKCCNTGLMSYCKEFVERNLTGVRMDGSSSLLDRGEPLRGAIRRPVILCYAGDRYIPWCDQDTQGFAARTHGSIRLWLDDRCGNGPESTQTRTGFGYCGVWCRDGGSGLRNGRQESPASTT